MISLKLTLIDYIVIFIYFLSILYIGWRVSRKTNTGEDLFLAGRSLGFLSIGFSLFATNVSSTSLIGLSGFAYREGIAVSNYEWMAAIILVIMSIFIIPIYIKTKIQTLPEYLKFRFGTFSQKYFSIITIILCIFLDSAGGIYAGVLVLDTFNPGPNLWLYSFILTVIAGLYSIMGGLKAVAYTDIIQATILILGSFLLTYFLFKEFNFDWHLMTQGFNTERMSLIRPLDDLQAPWLGTLIGIPFMGFWFWATNHIAMQRILGAKNISHARWGALFAGALKLLPLFIMVIPGAIAINLIPDLSNPDLIFPYMITHLLPAGAVGLVIAGLMAAIMSSLDSSMNSAASLIIFDFVKPKNPELTERQLGMYGRITMIVIMALAATCAPIIAEFGGIFAYFQKAFSVVVPPVVAIFILGLFTHRGGPRTAAFTLITGHIVGSLLFILSIVGYLQIHYTITAGFSTLTSMLFFILVSYILDEKVGESKYVTGVLDTKPQTNYPWYLDYRFFAILILVATFSIVIAFW